MSARASRTLARYAPWWMNAVLARRVEEDGDGVVGRRLERARDVLVRVDVGRVRRREALRGSARRGRRLSLRVEPRNATSRAALRRHLLEGGELRAARVAPRRPLVDHHGVPAQLPQAGRNASTPPSSSSPDCACSAASGGGAPRELLAAQRRRSKRAARRGSSPPPAWRSPSDQHDGQRRGLRGRRADGASRPIRWHIAGSRPVPPPRLLQWKSSRSTERRGRLWFPHHSGLRLRPVSSGAAPHVVRGSLHV